MFCVECKNQPGTYWVDKKSFEQITANAEHHMLEKVCVGIELTSSTKIQNNSNEEPLTSKGVFGDEEKRAGDGLPLVSPEMDFGEN